MSQRLKYTARPVKVADKAPAAEVVYGLDWVPYLRGYELLSSQWIVEDVAGGLKIIEQSANLAAKQTTVMLGGGLANRTYLVTNRIKFQPEGGGGAVETDERSINVPVVVL